MDYVVVREGKTLPIEVKAGRRGAMQSMYQFLEKKGGEFGVRCSLEPYASYEKIKVYPLYAVSEI